MTINDVRCWHCGAIYDKAAQARCPRCGAAKEQKDVVNDVICEHRQLRRSCELCRLGEYAAALEKQLGESVIAMQTGAMRITDLEKKLGECAGALEALVAANSEDHMAGTHDYQNASPRARIWRNARASLARARGTA